ncbi:dynein regulatory complex protein 10-like [Styela clava]
MTEVLTVQHTRDVGAGVLLPPLNLKSKKSNRTRSGSANSQQGVAAALRILDPARKKLGTVETQRIIACLDETIRRHELLAILPTITLQLARFSVSLGNELVAAIQTHKEKCALLEDVTKYSKDSEKLEKLRLEVSESCKNVMREFSLNPAVATALRRDLILESTEQIITHQDAKIIEALKELRAIMLELLLTTPAEESDRSSYLDQVSKREKQNSTVINKLQAQLDSAIEDKEQETSKKTETIRRLKNDLFQIEQFSEEHIRRTKTESDKQQASDTRNSDAKQSKLKSDIDQVQDQFSRMLQENREVEQGLRKRKYKIETEVENWIQKYDQDMGDRQNEYEQIDKVYTEEKKQLSELEEKFKVLEEEYNKIMEERRIAREKREQEERELAANIKAAVTIQAYFRAYKVRKALKNKSKKGGKKGGKKKGKK